MTFTVGLSGGIASGKSTVARLFVALSVPLIDADLIAHQVVQAGSPGLAGIIDVFGPAMLTDEGQLDRARMRQEVFANEDARRQLEAIVHPLVRSEMQAQIQAVTQPYCIVDVPLLAESKGHYHFHRILIVDIDPQIQRRRLKARDQLDDQQIDQILAAQAGREERLALADDVIDNSGTLDQLEKNVGKLHVRYQSLADAMSDET